MDPKAPVLDLDFNNSTSTGANYATTFTENGGGIPIADLDVKVTDTDDTYLKSATISLTNAEFGDTLTAGSLPAGITVDLAQWTSTKIVLSGHATIADYQTALKAIQFNNSSEDPSTTARDITVVVNDGDMNSNTAHTTVTVVAVNDAPDIHLVTSDTAAATRVETNAGLSAGGTLTVNDVDVANTVSWSVISVTTGGTTTGWAPTMRPC